MLGQNSTFPVEGCVPVTTPSALESTLRFVTFCWQNADELVFGSPRRAAWVVKSTALNEA